MKFPVLETCFILIYGALLHSSRYYSEMWHIQRDHIIKKAIPYVQDEVFQKMQAMLDGLLTEPDQQSVELLLLDPSGSRGLCCC